MARRDIEQRIAATERQLARLRESDRQRTTHQKIVIGALMMKEADANAAFRNWFVSHLRKVMTPGDRQKFQSYLSSLDSAIKEV